MRGWKATSGSVNWLPSLNSSLLLMSQSSLIGLRGAALLGAAIFTSDLALCQGLIQTQGVVIAAEGMSVPGIPGAVFAGPSAFDSSVIDETGKSFFRARVIGPGITSLNERGLFYGSSPADLALVIQGGDPAPGLPGVTLNSASASGINGTVRLSPDGEMMWASALSGLGVSMTNDTAFFVGKPGNFVVAVREGDPAPGTAGAVFSSSFSSLSQQFTMLDRAGRVLFRSTLAGGDVVGTTNNEAWFYGFPGALQLIMRKGETTPGGQVIESLGFVCQSNAAGQVLVETNLSTTLGTPPATTANDRSLWIVNTGTLTKTLVLREGDAAPGTVGATFSAPADAWTVNASICGLTAAGDCMVAATLNGGDTTISVNDQALYRISTTGKSLLVRKGDPATGTDGVFSVFNVSSIRLSETGFSFQGGISGGTSTPTDDSGMWVGSSAGLALIAREGNVAPGTTGGALIGEVTSLPVNALTIPGQLFFQLSLVGGIGGSAWYAWDVNNGLVAVSLVNDQIETLPTVFKMIGSFGTVQFSNTNNVALSTGHDGLATTRLGFTDGTSGVATVQLPPFGPTVYCKANPTSQGCTPAIASSGIPSASAGSGFSISCTNMVPQTNGLMFYSLLGPTNLPFLDGILCVQPPLIRTPIQNSGGAAACSGVFSLDFNAFIALGSDPGLVQGAQVWTEFWGRDSAAPSTTSLSDALAFTIGL